MGKYLGATGLGILWNKIKATFAKKTDLPTATSDLVNDSVLLPNFDNLTPIKTIEYDVARAGTYNLLFTRSNSNISTTMAEVNDVVMFRMTVTGTNIYEQFDVFVKFQNALVYPLIYGINRTFSNIAATTGTYNMRCGYPKTLNSGYPWVFDYNEYNATARHIKIEVFSTTENITWCETLTTTTYNSSYQTVGSCQPYANRGLITIGTVPIKVTSSGQADFIAANLAKYINGSPIKAGEALVTYDLIFINNGFAYRANNKEVSIDTDYGICAVGTNYSLNSTVNWSYLRLIWSFTFTSASNHGLTYDTFIQGNNVYLRCTMREGKVYSDGHLAKEMTAGYTWYHLGTIYNTTNGLAMNTTSSMFITLDNSGCISHINGKPTNATMLTEGVNDENTFLKRHVVFDGNAEVKKISGNSIVWNQFANGTMTLLNANTIYENGYNTITLTDSSTQVRMTAHYYTAGFSKGEVILCVAHVKEYNVENAPLNKIRISYIHNVTKAKTAVKTASYGVVGTTAYGLITLADDVVSSDALGFYFDLNEAAVFEHTTNDSLVTTYNIFNLTKMFGAGREPATVDEVEALFPDDYYEYNDGELLSLSMTGLKTTKLAGGTLSTLPLNVTTITGKAEGSNESVIIFPDGMNGIGSVQDEIDFEAGKAVKRIGSVDLGSFSWLRTSSSSMYYFYFNGTSFDWIVPSSDDDIKRQSILCDKYSVTTTLSSAISTTLASDKTIVMRAQGSPAIRDDSYEDAASFKTAVTGTKMLFELAEPIEYTLDTIPNRSYRVESGGKEIILPEANNDVVTAPATIVSHYGTNIIKALQDLEDGVVFAGDDDGQGVIAEGGDVNVIETVKVNGTALTPDANKAVNVMVPTTLSGLASDTTHRTVTDTEKSTWNGKQDALVSGTNLKTINNESILGSGNITIQGGSGGGGDENVIETVKVNGTALTPDANKAVNIDLTLKADLNGSPSHFFTASNLDVFDNGESCDISAIYADDKITLQFTDSVEGNTLSYTFNPGENERTIATTDDIPAAVTESTVSGWGFTKNTGTYSKPSGGIPASDLASGVIPTVPTNVSAFTNDAGYLTSASVVTIYSGSTAPSSSLGNNGDIYIKTS